MTCPSAKLQEEIVENHIQSNVELIAKHEQEFLARRTTSERLGDAIAAFAGSFPFVGLHLVAFTFWITVNTKHIGHIPQFDPRPYSLLGTVVAVEAILLASFILMRQSRMARRGDERDHLMRQILLLTEKEITAVLKVDRHIAVEMGLDKVANTVEVKELSQRTSIENLAETIKESLPVAE